MEKRKTLSDPNAVTKGDPPWGKPYWEAFADRMQGWRVYYGDGTAFDSSHGGWEDAPSDGVQALVLFLEPPVYRVLEAGWDAYRIPGNSQEKTGTLIDTEMVDKIILGAGQDYDWPK